jgi:transcriptional regulator with XRE-family HTH domain
MERISPEELGQRMARKRGSMGIRAAAEEIGVSAATLSRVERGHLPDSRTLGKICIWVEIDPSAVIGGGGKKSETIPAVQIAFKRGQTTSEKTARSLAKLIVAAQRQFVEALGAAES